MTTYTISTESENYVIATAGVFNLELLEQLLADGYRFVGHITGVGFVCERVGDPEALV